MTVFVAFSIRSLDKYPHDKRLLDGISNDLLDMFSSLFFHTLFLISLEQNKKKKIHGVYYSLTIRCMTKLQNDLNESQRAFVYRSIFSRVSIYLFHVA